MRKKLEENMRSAHITEEGNTAPLLRGGVGKMV